MLSITHALSIYIISEEVALLLAYTDIIPCQHESYYSSDQ